MANTLTLSFAGTDCWPDEGLNRNQQNFNAVSGYIPARMHYELERQGIPSFVIPGCGAPFNHFREKLELRVWNWVQIDGEPQQIVARGTPAPFIPADSLEGRSVNYLAAHAMALIVGAPVQYLKRGIEPEHLKPADNPVGEKVAQTLGLKDMTPDREPIDDNPLLFWLRDDLAAIEKPQRIERVNMIGHSRGGVVAIAVANMIAEYLPHIEVNLIGLDPVPGTGGWPRNMCTLPQRVLGNYLGIYAIDEVSAAMNAVVPALADTSGKRWNMLEENGLPAGLDAKQYQLIFSRGRHSTIPGSQMSDGADFNPDNISALAGSVGELVHFLSLHHLRQWGTADTRPAPSAEHINRMKADIEEDGGDKDGLFFTMRNFTYANNWLGIFNTNGVIGYQNARGVSGSYGRNPSAWQYLEACLPADTPFKLGHTANSRIGHITPQPWLWQALTRLDNTAFGV